ncbi:hypothetical protein CAPTEDRAFT_201554 [Capitella teleta]|uniref:Uncharacterized protein n=1 Tax=Capitella teleta TaxID=283909 RepID=R7U9S2_CAPTE|nr:hypothetical protein CAPTEDRAFT_201554 [Capitella teleta]|eukprot:ELU02739.1 hypothetical protein CAPTEDRAFT_201554 [Capitella teleta]
MEIFSVLLSLVSLFVASEVLLSLYQVRGTFDQACIPQVNLEVKMEISYGIIQTVSSKPVSSNDIVSELSKPCCSGMGFGVLKYWDYPPPPSSEGFTLKSFWLERALRVKPTQPHLSIAPRLSDPRD